MNKEKIQELDAHWKEVMDLARKYGFIIQAYAGTATLMTHRNQIEAVGEESYTLRQRDMNGIDVT